MTSQSLCRAATNNVSYQKEWERRLAAATRELMPSTTTTNTHAFAGRSDLILRVDWVARTELLKYRDDYESVVEGKIDDWNVWHPEGTQFFMTTGGVVWWQTPTRMNCNRTWVASLTEEQARTTYDAFVSQLRKGAISVQPPDQSFRVSITTYHLGVVTEDAFYISNSIPVESILSDVKQNGTDERLNSNWMARPTQVWIQEEILKSK